MYYKRLRTGNFWSSNYIEYESNDVKNEKVSTFKEYVNKNRQDLKTS